MFGLGLPELIVIFVIALVVFGPKKLPDLGKSIGRAMAEFKKAQQDFQDSVQAEMKEVEKTTDLEGLKKLGRLDDLSAYKEAAESKPAEAEGAGQKTGPTPEQKPDQEKDEGATGNG
jgi:sec-independent protein translocase protein TatA